MTVMIEAFGFRLLRRNGNIFSRTGIPELVEKYDLRLSREP